MWSVHPKIWRHLNFKSLNKCKKSEVESLLIWSAKGKGCQRAQKAKARAGESKFIISESFRKGIQEEESTNNLQNRRKSFSSIYSNLMLITRIFKEHKDFNKSIINPMMSLLLIGQKRLPRGKDQFKSP